MCKLCLVGSIKQECTSCLYTSTHFHEQLPSAQDHSQPFLVSSNMYQQCCSRSVLALLICSCHLLAECVVSSAAAFSQEGIGKRARCQQLRSHVSPA